MQFVPWSELFSMSQMLRNTTPPRKLIACDQSPADSLTELCGRYIYSGPEVVLKQTYNDDKRALEALRLELEKWKEELQRDRIIRAEGGRGGLRLSQICYSYRTRKDTRCPAW